MPNNKYPRGFLFDLIQGDAVPARRKSEPIDMRVERERIARLLDAVTDPNSAQLALPSNADLPFLGMTVHVDHLVRLITHAKLITRRSDIKRLLSRRSDTVKLRFATTTESKQTLKLADLSQPSRPQK